MYYAITVQKRGHWTAEHYVVLQELT